MSRLTALRPYAVASLLAALVLAVAVVILSLWGALRGRATSATCTVAFPSDERAALAYTDLLTNRGFDPELTGAADDDRDTAVSVTRRADLLYIIGLTENDPRAQLEDELVTLVPAGGRRPSCDVPRFD